MAPQPVALHANRVDDRAYEVGWRAVPIAATLTGRSHSPERATY